jgi:hypothetical protein
MVDTTATVLLFTAALVGGLGLASIAVVAASALVMRVRRLLAARASTRVPERNAPTL